jgi:hypothetical protein
VKDKFTGNRKEATDWPTRLVFESHRAPRHNHKGNRKKRVARVT